MASQYEDTQPTQQVLDPRRVGVDNSGVDENDSSDIILLLLAGSAAATRIVEQTALARDYHVLFHDMNSYVTDIEEQETIIVGETTHQVADRRPADIALRFSSLRYLKQKYSGFVFGRNPNMVDIVFGQDSGKRISNQHFRIYLNADGLVMLEDLSTNGTRVDNTVLKSKDPRAEKTRVLTTNSEIIIANSASDNEIIRFHVRIPPRSSQAQIWNYEENKRAFMSECFVGQERDKVLRRQQQPYQTLMRWNGGHNYTIMGELGKGAFATVYKIATKMNGTVLAAKELEKRRFMKDGLLDKKVENELSIMRNLKHPNVVQFIDYHDQGDYLYIIMEYAPYGDLRKHMEAGLRPDGQGPMKEDVIRPVAQQVLSALAHLHSQKVTHRDIKPDNILISELEPIQVKLSDFGLSKMVQHEETFLKTFCGTLLYCAPEVFPFYEKSRKRRRGNEKAYSSACDIYSLGGVLWNALCGAPPFEGKQDTTGRAMFDHIMETELDVRPLTARKVSIACIDLLTQMLRRDPSQRPTEVECLQHPWLRDGATIPEDPTLESIVEEDEIEDEAEHQLSQLSINSGVHELDEADEADVLSDEEFGHLIDARQSKRVRHDPLYARYQVRDGEDGSSGAPSPQSDMEGVLEGESFQPIPKASNAHRLFGEIGKSALESSGVLTVHAKQALSEAGSVDSGVHGPSNYHKNGRRRQASTGNTPTLDRDVSSSSLFGAESGVRELNMASPQSFGSGRETSNEPATPKTPEVPQHNSLGYSQKNTSQSSEPTPRARPPLSRLISLPKTPLLYYDAADPSTHNIEYAQKVSGVDFTGYRQDTTQGASIADTMDQHGHGDSDASVASGASAASGASVDSGAALPVQASPSLPTTSDFKAPPRRVGKLVATADSFDPSLTLNIDQRLTSWGRNTSCTIVYEDPTDTRVPKIAFFIFWWSPSDFNLVQELSQNGQDWTNVEDLQAGIFTHARAGLWVNGKHLRQRDDKGRGLYGNLHSGDIIQVFVGPRNECLKFKCEFYHGKSVVPRPTGQSFKVQCGGKLN